MDVHFVAPDLRRLDALKSEALAVPFFEDERPLCGVVGLADWRLCGKISRLVIEGRISGSLGETLLLSARPRLPFEKLFVFGVGPKDTFGPAVFEHETRRMLAALAQARVRAPLLALPGRALDLIDPARAMELFLRVAVSLGEPDEVTLVEPIEAQRAMAPVVSRERRRVMAAEA